MYSHDHVYPTAHDALMPNLCLPYRCWFCPASSYQQVCAPNCLVNML